MSNDKTRHILCLSGGKDSTALAVYMKDKVPNLEYLFTDTGKELPETYEYLTKIETILDIKISRVNPDNPFDHFLTSYGNFLPSANMRWCTKNLKILPFEKFVGDGPVVSYVGIRADENRSGYISKKPNITAKFPFQEDGIVKEDVYRILEESGLGLPKYYEWRSRSGCYFCFFQRKSEWMGLKKTHPKLFELAKKYEKIDPKSNKRFTWIQGESLDELSGREKEIWENYYKALDRAKKNKSKKPLAEIFDDVRDDENEDSEASCLMCHI